MKISTKFLQIAIFTIFILSVALTPISPLVQFFSKVNAEEGSFDFKVLDHDIEDSVEPNTAVQANVELENTGTLDWDASNVDFNVTLTYEWISFDGTITPGSDSMLSDNVMVGDSINQPLTISSPTEIGEYTLALYLRPKLSTDLIPASDGSSNITVQVESGEEIMKPKLDITVLNNDGSEPEQGDKPLIYENHFKVNLKNESNVAIKSYAISTSSIIQDDEWVTNEQSRNEITTSVSTEDKTGNYTFYAAIEDINGNKTDVKSFEVRYEKYSITSQIEFLTQDELFAGTSKVSIKLTNTGEDTAYNTGAKVVLPKGFSYLEPLYKDLNGKLISKADLVNQTVSDPITPSKIIKESKPFHKDLSQNYEAEILIFENIDNLLPGESIDINLLLQSGGLDDGYTLEDVIPLFVESTLYPKPTSAKVKTASEEFTIQLKPFTAEVTPEVKNARIGDIIKNTITINFNKDIANTTADSSTDPFVVEIVLTDGISYVEGSAVIDGLISGVSSVVFTEGDSEHGNNTLTWTFEEPISPNQYTKPVSIAFDTIVEKAKGLGEEFTKHNETLTNDITVTGQFEASSEESSITSHTLNLQQEVTAKYFTVRKWSEPDIITVGQVNELTYHIEVKTSNAYELSGIELTDLLPDGVSFDEDNAALWVEQNFNIELMQHSTQTNGKETLIWRMYDANGIPTNGTLHFSYKVFVQNTYEQKDFENDQRFFSEDVLTSSVTVRGLWTDAQGDRPEPAEERMIEETGYTGISTVQVGLEQKVKLSTEPNYSESLDIRSGDTLDVYTKIQFPSTPTRDFGQWIYIPQGLELVEDSIQIDTNIPEGVDLEANKDGFMFDQKKIEPNAYAIVSYQLYVTDAESFKNAVMLEPAFRTIYYNIDGTKFTYRDSLQLRYVEPEITVYKSVAAGSLARGETATIVLSVKNTGLDTAYGVSLADDIPSRTTFVEGSLQVLKGNIFAQYNSDTNQIGIYTFNLPAGEDVVISYDVITDSDTKFGDPISSKILVSEYSNRDATDPLAHRTYPEKTYHFNWKAGEALLVTDIVKSNMYRGEVGSFSASVRPVGNAPLYNLTYSVDIQDFVDVIEDMSTITCAQNINGISEDLIINQNSITHTIEKLNQNETIQISCSGLIKKYIPFGSNGQITIEAIAFDKLGEEIRKDGFAENPNDIDEDDQDSADIIIEPKIVEAPIGDISFIVDGIVVTKTNQDFVEAISYFLQSSDEIIGVQFSHNKNNWYTIPELQDLDDSIEDSLQLNGDWNAWDPTINTVSHICISSSKKCSLVEGENIRYMKVLTVQGGETIIQGTVIKDTEAPTHAKLIVSPFAFDFSNPSVTGVFTNYANIQIIDSPEVAVDETEFFYQYSFDGTTWSDWLYSGSASAATLLEFPPVDEEQELKLYVKVKDIAGNEFPASLYDSIIFKHDIPSLTLTLGDGEQYTNNPVVKHNISTNSSILKLRFTQGENCTSANQLIDCFWEDWTYFEGEMDIFRNINKQWEDGNKQVCVQIESTIGVQSHVACDSIILDRAAPVGYATINNGLRHTNNINTTLYIDAQDPKLPDTTHGVGGIQMRFSKIGLDCKQFTDETQKTTCEQSWTSWENFTTTKPWALENNPGEQVVYVQFQDALGNISSVFEDRINYNPYLQLDGTIIINNDDLFTNTKNVTLFLDSTPLGDGAENEPGEKVPVLMRFYETDNQALPPQPPIVNSPDDNSNGWTYWEEFSTTKQWELKGEFGVKTVYVQFMMGNTAVTQIYNDSIIYAPYYAIQYKNISTIPQQVKTQDTFTVRLNVKNIGSFTWPQEGNNPVHLTYTWKLKGAEGDNPMQTAVRGNSVVLPQNISWNQETGELELIVDTPLFAGDYELQLDAVHEGVAWFKDFANPSPKYNVNVELNSELPEIPEDLLGGGDGQILGDMDYIVPIGGAPIDFPDDRPNCADHYNSYLVGVTCYIGGTLLRHPNQKDYDYLIYGQETGKPDTVHPYNFNLSNDQAWDGLLDKDVLVTVYVYGYDPKKGNLFNIQNIQEAPKTWVSEMHANHNDPKLFQPIAVEKGTTFQIQPRLLNNGSATWFRGEVELVSITKPLEQGGTETGSLFSDGSWKNASRVHIDPNQSGYGWGSLGTFTFSLTIPTDIPYGDYKQCFVMTNIPFRPWMRRDSFCLTLDVQMDYEEEREFVCNQPQEVYAEQVVDPTKIIGYLNKDQKFIITEDHSQDGGGTGGWLKIYLPDTGQTGWVESNYDCFSAPTIIEKPIPKPNFDIIPQPTGDQGFVICVNGVDVKDGPADMFNTIKHLAFGDEVQVLAETFINDNYGGWLLIRTSDSTEGWVPKGCIKHINDPKDIQVVFKPLYAKAHICGDNVAIYKGPSDKYPRATPDTAQKNSNLAIIRQWTNAAGEVWYQIYTSENYSTPGALKTGWIKQSASICQGLYAPIYQPYCGGEVSWPYAKQWPITSGYRTPNRPTHEAIDIGAPHGTPVLAAAPGYISFAGMDKYGGIYVDVTHPHLGIKTRYLHLSKITRNSGEVKVGQEVGLTGSTGLSTGPHLHFSVYDLKTGRDLNPLEVLGNKGGTCAIDGSQDQKGLRNEFEKLVKEKEDMWDEETPAGDWRGEPHLWNEQCSVWVKDYDWVKDNGQILANKDWTGNGMSGGVLVYNPKKVYLVANGIWVEYFDVGGPCGLLGLPTATDGAYTERPAGISPDSQNNGVTAAAYQRFQKGTIYWHWNDSKSASITHAVYGPLSKAYEDMGGTWSSYGFPTSDQFKEDVRTCQEFEFGKICVGENFEGDDPDDFDYYAGMENLELEIEPEMPDLQTALGILASDLQTISFISLAPWDMFKTLESVGAWAHFFYGVLKGFIESLVDTIEFFWNLLTKFGDTVGQLLDAIGAILRDPTVLLYMLFDVVEEFFNKPHVNDRMQMIGEFIGQFIPDLIFALLGGAGFVKSATKALDLVKDFAKNSKIIAKAIKLADKIKDIRVAGGKILKGLKFNSKGNVHVLDLVESLKNTPLDEVVETIDNIPTIPLQNKGYIKLKHVENTQDLASGLNFVMKKSSNYRSKFIEAIKRDIDRLDDIDHRIPYQLAQKNPVGTKQALEKLGLYDINDLKLLQAVDRSINRGPLNKLWTDFIKKYPNANGDQIVDFLKSLDVDYPQYIGDRIPGSI